MEATSRAPGRPRQLSDQAILTTAFAAFSQLGYDAVSVRELNRELGVSHSAIRKRFGSKQQLWQAAVDHAFGQLVDALRDPANRAPDDLDDLERLRQGISAFIREAARRPQVLQLMNQEGGLDTPRLDYIVDTYIAPALAPTARLLRKLERTGVIKPISLPAYHFLVAHGAAGPFTHTALAQRLDPNGLPLNPAEHAERAATIIVNGLRRAAP
ncbi:MAG: TetR/AcrR family transcriptional regulator [Acidimicrobiia bacterium]|nr:TetR/AcrR family transcriptional regulator [Acidimicrobiia bacterium]